MITSHNLRGAEVSSYPILRVMVRILYGVRYLTLRPILVTRRSWFIELIAYPKL